MFADPRALFGHFLIAATLAFILSGSAAAQEGRWTRFHGDNGTGVALDARLPSMWTSEDYAWKIDLPGTGAGAPVIWDDLVFINSSDPETAEQIVLCISAVNGSKIWQRSFPSSKHHLHSRNTFAASTLAVDDSQVYVAFANKEHTWLLALSHDGEEKWRRDFGTYVSSHGFGSSPIVVGEKVILINSQQAIQLEKDQQPGRSRVIAVNRSDGSDIWEAPLIAKRVCYGAPCLVKRENGRTEVVGANTGNGFYGIDVETGGMNWSTKDSFSKRVVASPVFANGMLLASAGSGGGGNYLVAVQIDSAPADGQEAGQPKEVYRIPRASYVPSPIVVDNLLFLFSDKGIVACYDALTGKEHWKKRVSKGFSGSPVATRQSVYCIDEEGNIHVVAASKSPQHEIADALGQASRSTPAIAGNRIYFRSESKLFALEGKQ